MAVILTIKGGAMGIFVVIAIIGGIWIILR